MGHGALSGGVFTFLERHREVYGYHPVLSALPAAVRAPRRTRSPPLAPTHRPRLPSLPPPHPTMPSHPTHPVTVAFPVLGSEALLAFTHGKRGAPSRTAVAFHALCHLLALVCIVLALVAIAFFKSLYTVNSMGTVDTSGEPNGSTTDTSNVDSARGRGGGRCGAEAPLGDGGADPVDHSTHVTTTHPACPPLSPFLPVHFQSAVYSPHAWCGISTLCVWALNLGCGLVKRAGVLQPPAQARLRRLHAFFGKLSFAGGLASCALGYQDMQGSDLAAGSYGVLSANAQTASANGMLLLVLGAAVFAVLELKAAEEEGDGPGCCCCGGKDVRRPAAVF